MINSTYEAYCAGIAAAQALQPGDRFRGAFAEASARYHPLTRDRKHFINGYLDGISAPVVTDEAGIIVSLGEQS